MKNISSHQIFGLIGSSIAGYIYYASPLETPILFLALLGLIGPFMFFAAFRGKIRNKMDLDRYVRNSTITGIIGLFLIHAYFVFQLSQLNPGEQLFYTGDFYFLFLATVFAYGLSNNLGERIKRKWRE